MNTGVISVRYAKALLEYVQETGGGQKACEQAIGLLEHPDTWSEPLCPEIEALVRLLIENGRMEYVRFVLNSFVRLYRESAGIKTARLATVVRSPEWEEVIRRKVESKMGCKIQLETSVDPSLIGGFVLEVDDYRMDSSIRGELAEVKRRLEENTERIN